VEIDKVKELVELMVDHNLSSIALRDGDEEITLRRAGENGAVVPTYDMVAPRILPMGADVGSPPVAAASAVSADSGVVDDVSSKNDESTVIPSPMVGTLYSSPNPDAPLFVQVGTRVTPDTVVCIIEAMKVFNEIRAEISGVIEQILVANEQAVEYGQPLFSVRPD
jgi:acetyl-CoA carboxylase biotin carboxyl carrier protein